MPCFTEKMTAGAAGAAIAAGGGGLIVSTSTGPAFFFAAAGWLAACAAFGIALGKVALCLAENGQPEMAAAVRERVNAIEREIDKFKTFARGIGVSL